MQPSTPGGTTAGYSLDSSTQKEKKKKKNPPFSSCSSESAVCRARRAHDGHFRARRAPGGRFRARRRIKGCGAMQAS